MNATPGVAAIALATVALLAPSRPAAGAEPPMVLAVQDAQLPRVACAARNLLWKDGYQVALYMPESTRPLESAIGAAMPKAVRIDVTWQGQLPKELPGRWQERLRQGVPQDTFQQVMQLYSRLGTGDSVLAAHVPGRGSSVSVNGKRAFATADARLVDTLLDMFVGPEPVSRNTKRILLEPGC